MAVVGSVVGSGGIGIGGTADVAFVHGSGAALSGVVLEWDFDNDGDFDQPAEDITGTMVEAETRTGRDWPSQLTGKAGPGELKAALRNDDNRFSVFNANSPLNQAPNSLDLGRKLRIRTAEADDPDPVLLVRDRFRQPDGPLTTAETGQTWEQPGPTFAIVDGVAVATTTGAGHVAVVDTGSADHYVQATTGANALSGNNNNAVGLVFRYVDSGNLSIFQARADQPGTLKRFEYINVVAGTPTTVSFTTRNVYDRNTLAAHAHGTTVDLYVEGHLVNTQTAINPGATRAGIWGQWAPGTASKAPELSRIDVWDSATARTEGIIWTGDVADIHPTSALGPDRTAALTGEGPMSRLATQRVRFPGLPAGTFAQIGVGKTLADSNLLQPPGERTPGEYASPVTSALGLEEADAIEVARLFEDHEGGLLYEAQEGWVNFEGRDARAGRPVTSVWSDEPGAQFGYDNIELLGWRREIFNQVDIGVGHLPPSVRSSFTDSLGAWTEITFAIPASLNAGELLIGFATCSGASGTTVTWLVPPGWVHLTSDKPLSTNPTSAGNNYRIYAKVADGTESAEFFPIAQASANLAFATQLWVIRDWFGDISQGIQLSDEAFSSDPPPVSPNWSPQASRIIAVRWGRAGDATVADWSQQIFDGFFGGFQVFNSDTAGRNVAIQAADKTVAAESVIDPAPFDGDFSGFVDVVTRTLAIRGATLAPAEPSGVTRLVADDMASQDRHNATRSFILPPSLYQPTTAGEAAATGFAEALLARYASPRPVVRITWYAHTNQAYRSQATRRRVGDKIRLVASSDQSTGMGINGEFFIENIVNRFADGGTVWDVTWELSPA